MIYHFSGFVSDSSPRELHRGGVLVPLKPPVFDLLEFPIRAHDQVVSRDELLDTVWRGRTVSDATLSGRVNAARMAIGDVAAVKLGQNDKASVIAKELIAVEPELTISGFSKRIPFPRDTMAANYTEALRAAGVS